MQDYSLNTVLLCFLFSYKRCSEFFCITRIDWSSSQTFLCIHEWVCNNCRMRVIHIHTQSSEIGWFFATTVLIISSIYTKARKKENKLNKVWGAHNLVLFKKIISLWYRFQFCPCKFWSLCWPYYFNHHW